MAKDIRSTYHFVGSTVVSSGIRYPRFGGTRRFHLQVKRNSSKQEWKMNMFGSLHLTRKDRKQSSLTLVPTFSYVRMLRRLASPQRETLWHLRFCWRWLRRRDRPLPHGAWRHFHSARSLLAWLIIHPEYGGSTYLRSICKFLRNYSTPHLMRYNPMKIGTVLDKKEVLKFKEHGWIVIGYVRLATIIKNRIATGKFLRLASCCHITGII
jgi:hypothetical protein